MTLLNLEHVGKAHRVGPYEKRVLVDVSLSVGAADFVGVWGAQRSGKTTLLRIAGGLERPDEGVVRFDGVDLGGLSKGRRDGLRLRDIGLVLGEGPRRRAMTMLDYVAIPLFGRFKPAEARRRALTVLKRLDVLECRDARWEQLSDSEKLLVGLAHGLVREPRLLLVDYGPAGIDTLQQQEIVERLHGVVAEEGVAVLMTSSNLAAVTEAHAAFTLSSGRLLPVSDSSRPGGEVIELRRNDGQTGS